MAFHPLQNPSSLMHIPPIKAVRFLTLTLTLTKFTTLMASQPFVFWRRHFFFLGGFPMEGRPILTW